jgi:hypothetical protein
VYSGNDNGRFTGKVLRREAAIGLGYTDLGLTLGGFGGLEAWFLAEFFGFLNFIGFTLAGLCLGFGGFGVLFAFGVLLW